MTLKSKILADLASCEKMLKSGEDIVPSWLISGADGDWLIGDASCNALHKIAVGIDEGAAAAGADVLQNQVFKKRRFAGAGLANDVEVRELASLLDAEKAMLVAGIGAGEDEG
jgi:hypothetical protein